MISDVQEFNEAMKWKNIDVSASYSDAREINTERKYDAIITSPPYPNRHDYTRIYSLEMLFDFVKSNDDLKKFATKLYVRMLKLEKNMSRPSMLNLRSCAN